MGLTLPWKKPTTRALSSPRVSNDSGMHKMWLPMCLSHQSQTCLFIPLSKQELGSQEEMWLKAFRVLCWPSPASAGAFFPCGGPSPSHSAAHWGSKLLHPIHMDTIPGGGGHPSSIGTTAGFPWLGWGTLGWEVPVLRREVSSRV